MKLLHKGECALLKIHRLDGYAINFVWGDGASKHRIDLAGLGGGRGFY